MSANRASGRQGALGAIKRELDAYSLTPTVRAKVGNHYEDITKLAASLKKLGLEHQEIDGHVIDIFNEYRAALLQNIERVTAQ